MAWFFFLAPVGALVVQCLCLAASIYLDERPDPVFGRWVAHLNVVVAVLLLPSAFGVLVKSGPLAWNGGISFTLRLVVLAAYLVTMFVVLLGAVKRQGDERAELV
jgi:hypothetical protein